MRTIVIWASLAATQLAGQWLHYPTPGLPRTKDGKPNLTAPTPRTPDGKPDFSGFWQAPNGRQLANLAAGGVEVPMLPWAAKLFQERQENHGKDSVTSFCMPHSVVEFDAHFTPRKLLQLPGELVLLFEGYHRYRQIFTDGRPLPEVVEPAWFGYSVGKWTGNVLAVDTIGINERNWLDDGGHPHSDALHLVERFQRPDVGHMQLELTIDDPKTYTRPWTVQIPWIYIPDTELMDWVCENNKDREHMVGK